MGCVHGHLAAYWPMPKLLWCIILFVILYLMKDNIKGKLLDMNWLKTMQQHLPVMCENYILCDYFSAFQTEGKLYLILEFLRGGDLFTRLSKEVQNVYNLSDLVVKVLHFSAHWSSFSYYFLWLAFFCDIFRWCLLRKM